MARADSRRKTPDRIDAAISAYLSNEEGRRIVSTGTAVRLLRSQMPDCEFSDEELADRIAMSAIERGLCVAFEERQNDAQPQL